jgi:hypothetical protein
MGRRCRSRALDKPHPIKTGDPLREATSEIDGNGHGRMSALSLLPGAKRKSHFGAGKTAFDP